MGIFPAWINITPTNYPILIYPDSPINDILYLNEPPIVYDCSYKIKDDIEAVDSIIEVTHV